MLTIGIAGLAMLVADAAAVDQIAEPVVDNGRGDFRLGQGATDAELMGFPPGPKRAAQSGVFRLVQLEVGRLLLHTATQIAETGKCATERLAEGFVARGGEVECVVLVSG